MHNHRQTANNKYAFYPSDEFNPLGMHIYDSIRNMEMKNFHQIKVNSNDVHCKHTHTLSYTDIIPNRLDTLMGKRNSQQQCDDNNHSVYEHLLEILWFASYNQYTNMRLHLVVVNVFFFLMNIAIFFHGNLNTASLLPFSFDNCETCSFDDRFHHSNQCNVKPNAIKYN